MAHNGTVHVKLLIHGDGVCGALLERLVNLFILAQHG